MYTKERTQRPFGINNKYDICISCTMWYFLEIVSKMLTEMKPFESKCPSSGFVRYWPGPSTPTPRQQTDFCAQPTWEIASIMKKFYS